MLSGEHPTAGRGLEIQGPATGTGKGLQAAAERADGISLADLSNLLQLAKWDGLIKRDRCRLIASHIPMTQLVRTTVAVGRIAEAMEDHRTLVPPHHDIARLHSRITTVAGHLTKDLRRRVVDIIHQMVIGMGGGSS
jgi:hypothetical protein